MKVELIRHPGPDAERMLVYIARVSSSREDKTAEPEKLIRYLIDHHHWSPFEHDYLTFEIVTSRAIGRQLLRHRSFTFQEFSQRYAEAQELEEIEIRAKSETNRQSSTAAVDHLTSAANRAAEESLRAYKILLEIGAAPETARMVLPEATQTRIYMTGCLRSWIHFLQERTSEGAQKEIREVAEQIKAQIAPHYPHTWEALKWT